jgi:hypothetical protein
MSKDKYDPKHKKDSPDNIDTVELPRVIPPRPAPKPDDNKKK